MMANKKKQPQICCLISTFELLVLLFGTSQRLTKVDKNLEVRCTLRSSAIFCYLAKFYSFLFKFYISHIYFDTFPYVSTILFQFFFQVSYLNLSCLFLHSIASFTTSFVLHVAIILFNFILKFSFLIFQHSHVRYTWPCTGHTLKTVLVFITSFIVHLLKHFILCK